MRTLLLEEIKNNSEFIGSGGYGSVYMLDQFRVIKIMHPFSWWKEIHGGGATVNGWANWVLASMIREIEGATEDWFESPCPILEEVLIEETALLTTMGLIKPYIPGHKPTDAEMDAASERHYRYGSPQGDMADRGARNYRTDCSGRLWRVDTDHRQTNW